MLAYTAEMLPAAHAEGLVFYLRFHLHLAWGKKEAAYQDPL